MLFTWDLPVLTTYTANAPHYEELVVARGVISRVSALFPAGCHGQVHMVIYHGSHPIFPSRDGMTLRGDDIPIEWDEYYELYSKPYLLTAKLWGVGCSYNHNITLRLVILPRKAIVSSAVEDAVATAMSSVYPRPVSIPQEE